MILTNRHHHTRWSLEQNREISDDPTLEKRRHRSWQRALTGAAMAAAGTVALIWLGMMLWRWRSWDASDEDLVDAASILVNDHHSNEALGVLLPVEPIKGVSMNSKSGPSGLAHTYAYVTLLCDNDGLSNARVLAYALQRAKAAYPLIVMTLPHATEGLEDLITLGATIERIPMVPVPFKRPNGKRPSYQKRCRYSKIHAWSLTKYQKLVYLDPNLLIVSVSLVDLARSARDRRCRTLMSFSSIPSCRPSRLSATNSTRASWYCSPLCRRIDKCWRATRPRLPIIWARRASSTGSSTTGPPR